MDVRCGIGFFVQTDVNKTQSAAMFTIHGGATGYRYAASGLKEWVLVIRSDKSDERRYGKCQVAGHLDITITASSDLSITSSTTRLLNFPLRVV